jgi:hypothetical protein
MVTKTDSNPMDKEINLLMTTQGYDGVLNILNDTKDKGIIRYLADRDYSNDDASIEERSSYHKADMNGMVKGMALRRSIELRDSEMASRYLKEKIEVSGPGIGYSVGNFIDIVNFSKEDDMVHNREDVLFAGNTIINELSNLKQYDQAAKVSLFLMKSILGRNNWGICKQTYDFAKNETQQETRLFNDFVSIVAKKHDLIDEMVSHNMDKANSDSPDTIDNQTFDYNNYYFPTFSILATGCLVENLIQRPQDRGLDRPVDYERKAQLIYGSLDAIREGATKLSFEEIGSRVKIFFGNTYQLESLDDLDLYKKHQPHSPQEIPAEIPPEMPPESMPFDRSDLLTHEEFETMMKEIETGQY